MGYFEQTVFNYVSTQYSSKIFKQHFWITKRNLKVSQEIYCFDSQNIHCVPVTVVTARGCMTTPMESNKQWGTEIENESKRSIEMERSVMIRPDQPRKVVHLEMWTHFFETFQFGPRIHSVLDRKFPEILVEWITPCNFNRHSLTYHFKVFATVTALLKIVKFPHSCCKTTIGQNN